MEELDSPSRYTISINSGSFTLNNNFKIIATYEDEAGQEYTVTKTVKVELKDLGIGDWILVALNTMGQKILSLGNI